MNGNRILLIDGSADLNAIASLGETSYKAVVCLFWAAPDTQKKVSDQMGCRCYSLNEMIPDVSSFEEEIYWFVRGLCSEGPLHSGLPLRTYLIEYIYREVRDVKSVMASTDFIRCLPDNPEKIPIHVDYILSTDNEAIFMKALSLQSGELPQIVPERRIRDQHTSVAQTGNLSFFRKLSRYIKHVFLNSYWKIHIWNFVEKLDDHLYVRQRLWKFRRCSLTGNERITFFSSYLNNSKILAAFEDLMPAPVHWVVLTYFSRHVLFPSKRSVDWLWQFSSRETYPLQTDEMDQCFPDATDAEKNLFIVWKSLSKIRRYWMKGWAASLQAMSACWEAYLVQATPKLVLMANQWGIEGWFSDIAQRRGVPVLQVMHGVLGGYLFTRTPIRSDYLVVNGEFWKRLWPEQEQRKIVVYNPQVSSPAKRLSPGQDRKQLTFFSWPLALVPSYNASEFFDGFIQILHKIASLGDYRVCVRFHPLENPSDMLGRWKKIYGSVPEGVITESSKKVDLEETISKTTVALMYRSTVMLNCLSHKIPFVMPGWVDFGWNKALLSGFSSIYLARDFRDLEAKILSWLSNPPETDPSAGSYFVRPEGEGSEEFLSLVSGTQKLGNTPTDREVFYCQ